MTSFTEEKEVQFPSAADLSFGIYGRVKDQIDINVQFKAKLQWQSRKMIENAKDSVSITHPASSMDARVHMATAEMAGEQSSNNLG